MARVRFHHALISFFVAMSLFFSPALTHASPQFVRWTKFEDQNADLSHILSVIQSRTGIALTASNLQLAEDRELAFTHYRRYLQLFDGVPLANLTLRIWFDETTAQAIQVEANLESPQSVAQLMQARLSPGTANTLSSASTRRNLSSSQTQQIARQAVAQEGQDLEIRNISWSDEWSLVPQATLTRVIKAKARRGEYRIILDLHTTQVISTDYTEYPQAGETGGRDEFSIAAQIYPIYERAEGGTEILPRVPGKLKYVHRRVARPRNPNNPYQELTTQHYLESMMDPVAGETESGRANGFWAMSYIKRRAAEIRNAMPLRGNSFPKHGSHRGVILDGRYATINLHPAAPASFQGLRFTPSLSSLFRPVWRETTLNGSAFYEMVPTSTLLGRRIMSEVDAWNRPARVLANNDPIQYLNDGFDELQVYFAVNTLFDELKARGWIDPDLSTRPFNAFLFDPDISMRDNAYYTDDTINFTTYSPGAPNFARDNPTIWHELGHGVMDRMMGDFLRLADTGGLSEGMADFVAALVVQAVSEGHPFPGSRKFRIINNTGFHLTNEVHDDGEAYGGSMKDLLDAAIGQWGNAGLLKITDLVLETMRLCRDHPALTASEWFSHMLFVDQLGRAHVRNAGELHDIILSAIQGRNFKLATDANSEQVARFELRNETDQVEVTSTSAGSRNRPIAVNLAANATKDYELSVHLTDADRYHFSYPVTVKVQFRDGPLQGAIKWVGESDEPIQFNLNSAQDRVRIPLQAQGQCDFTNRDDGSCVDFAYVQIFNNGHTEKPVAKKRFYLRVKPT